MSPVCFPVVLMNSNTYNLVIYHTLLYKLISSTAASPKRVAESVGKFWRIGTFKMTLEAQDYLGSKNNQARQ